MDPRRLARLRDVLERRGVRLAILFGSQARGRAHAGSDVDLAVEGEADVLGLAAALSSSVGCEVDVVELDRVGYPLSGELLREGVVVHEGRPGAAASWRTRVILEREADRPWFERMRTAYADRVASKGILGW